MQSQPNQASSQKPAPVQQAQPVVAAVAQPAVAAPSANAPRPPSEPRRAIPVQPAVAIPVAAPASIAQAQPQAPQLSYEAAKQLINDYRDVDRYHKVIQACNELINKAEEPRFFELRAKAYCHLQKYGAAMQDIERAMNEGGPTIDLLTTRGIIYRDRDKDHAQAQADFSQAIGMGASAFTMRMRGQSYLESGQKALAVTDYRAAVMRDPNNPGALYDAGNALLIAGIYDEAIYRLEEALKIRPDDRRTKALLAEAKEKQHGATQNAAQAAPKEGAQADLAKLKNLLDVRGMPVADIDAYGANVFLNSVVAGNVEIVTYLIEKGVRTDVVAEGGNNAIHLAVLNQHNHLLPILIPRIDCTLSNTAGDNPLEVAVKNGYVDTAGVLLGNGVSPQLPGKARSILTVAAASGRANVLESLLDMAFADDLLAIDQGIGGLIRAAIAAKKPEVLEFLLGLDKFPDAVETPYNGVPPLHQTVASGDFTLVNVVLTAGAKIDSLDTQKQTALQIATARHMNQIVARLNQALAARELEQKKEAQKQQQQVQKEQQEEKALDILIKDIISQVSKLDFPLHEKNVHNTTKMYNLLRENLLANKTFSNLLKEQKLNSAELIEFLVTDIKIRRRDIIKSLRNTISTKAATLAIQAGLMHWEAKAGNKAEASAAAAGGSKAEAKEDQEDAETMLQRHIWLNNLSVFCSQFETQFDEAFSEFSAIASGKQQAVPDANDALAAEIKKHSGALPNFSLPGVVSSAIGFNVEVPSAKIVNSLVDMALYIRTRFRKKEAERMADLFEAVTPFERTAIVVYTAERLGKKFQPQLMHLMAEPKGIIRLANSAVDKVLHYIVSDDTHQLASRAGNLKKIGESLMRLLTRKQLPSELDRQKGMFDIFVDGILKISTRSKLDSKRLRTISTQGDDWCAKGIFENTGVITPDGKRWAHPNVEIERYGYCFGTMHDVKVRGLTDEMMKGVPWGPGRIWEKRLIQATPDMEVTLYGIPHNLKAAVEGSASAASSSSAASASASASSSSGGVFSRWFGSKKKDPKDDQTPDKPKPK